MTGEQQPQRSPRHFSRAAVIDFEKGGRRVLAQGIQPGRSSSIPKSRSFSN
jgi:hypothetical protein